jgi:hypothetical protein
MKARGFLWANLLIHQSSRFTRHGASAAMAAFCTAARNRAFKRTAVSESARSQPRCHGPHSELSAWPLTAYTSPTARNSWNRALCSSENSNPGYPPVLPPASAQRLRSRIIVPGATSPLSIHFRPLSGGWFHRALVPAATRRKSDQSRLGRRRYQNLSFGSGGERQRCFWPKRSRIRYRDTKNGRTSSCSPAATRSARRAAAPPARACCYHESNRCGRPLTAVDRNSRARDGLRCDQPAHHHVPAQLVL